MRKPDIIMINGRAYSWRAVLELCLEQIEAWKAARPSVPSIAWLPPLRKP